MGVRREAWQEGWRCRFSRRRRRRRRSTCYRGRGRRGGRGRGGGGGGGVNQILDSKKQHATSALQNIPDSVMLSNSSLEQSSRMFLTNSQLCLASSCCSKN